MSRFSTSLLLAQMAAATLSRTPPPPVRHGSGPPRKDAASWGTYTSPHPRNAKNKKKKRRR